LAHLLQRCPWLLQELRCMSSLCTKVYYEWLSTPHTTLRLVNLMICVLNDAKVVKNKVAKVILSFKLGLVETSTTQGN
jgi:hypothetical protein